MTGAVVWLTGLPASGKSTLAARLASRLRDLRRPAIVLDSDEVRAALVPSHGYDETSRDAFYRTLGNLASLAAHQGLIALVPATAHRRRWRDAARAQAPRFVEVHVATPLEECRRRDPRGLYAGDARALPGVGVPYEAPQAPEVTVPPGGDAAAVDQVLALLGIAGR
jgi:adenylylsulfate kinase